MMKIFISFIVLFICTGVFAQDPNCEFILTLYDVEETKYEYKIIIDDDYIESKPSIDLIKKDFEERWSYAPNLETSLLNGSSNNKIIIAYKSGYCYPRFENTDQLRIIIARRNKRNKKVELMYGNTKLVPHIRNLIVIDKFKSGLRESETYSFEKYYHDNEKINHGHEQDYNLNSRIIKLI